MSEVKQIQNQTELLKVLDIDSIEELTNDRVKNNFFDLVRHQQISENLIRDLVKAVPELTKAFGAYIQAFSKVGCQVELTKQARWKMLEEAAKQGLLTGDQILEAMKIIVECEQKDPKINWEKIGDVAVKIGSGVTLVIVAVAGVLLCAFSKGTNRSGS